MGLVVMTIMAAVIVSGCQKPVLSADDTVTMGDLKSPITVYVTRKGLLEFGRRVPNVEIVIYVNGKEIDREKTNKHGYIDVEHLLPKDANSFEAKATIDGEEHVSEGRIFHWPQRTIVVVDVDETISNTDYEALLSGQDQDLRSTPLPHSVETLNKIAKHLNVFYLTARPRELLGKTKSWIKKHGFPAAPIVTSDSLGDVIDQQGYKLRTISYIRQQVPQVLIGIGDRNTDSEAYGQSGLLTIVIAEGDPKGFRAHAVILPGWKAIGEFLNVNVDTLKDPQKLEAVLAEGSMLQRPILKWKPSK